MRTFWLTAKIAAIFAGLLVLTLASTMHLFGEVVGRDLVKELITARADSGALVAEEVEALLADHTMTDPAMGELLRQHGLELDIQLVLLDEYGECMASSKGGRWCRARRPGRGFKDAERSVRARGRTARLGKQSDFEVFVPILVDGVEVGTLAMTSPDESLPDRGVFVSGLIKIGAAGLVAAALLSIYLTGPLRRMGGSMDRIATGELDHRVHARGRDEVASMGRSFNTMADRIEAMIRGQKELMAGVSHELRSPLSRMKLSLELLRAQGADEKRVADLESEVDALDGMVAELLVASRLDLGSQSLDPTPCSLEELASEGWSRVRTQAEAAGIELRVQAGDGADALRVDRALGVRLLGNLFENGVRYAATGPIELGASRDGDRVVIAVRDHGEGVAEEHLVRLFEPFYRADPSRTRKTGGTGLGLMIVRRAVEAHGGTVRAELPASGGLRVVFDLPAGS